MKSVYLKAGRMQDVFSNMKDSFNGTLLVNNDEYNLALQSSFAKGNIKGITFPDGITYMEFDMFFQEDVRLSMETYSTSPIFFAYCSQGSFQHSFGEQGIKKRIQKQYSGILKSAARVNSILYFEKYKPIQFSVLGIGTNATAFEKKSELIQSLKDTFFNTKKDYLSVRLQNYKIAEKIQELHTLTQKGIVRNLSKNRILESILKMEIEQNTDGFTEMGKSISSFVIKKIEEINTISDWIMNLPAEVAAKFTTLKAGLLASKLQEGFKFLSIRKIHDFLVFIRIERQRI